jgi:hypothetical protein
MTMKRIDWGCWVVVGGTVIGPVLVVIGGRTGLKWLGLLGVVLLIPVLLGCIYGAGEHLWAVLFGGEYSWWGGRRWEKGIFERKPKRRR